MFRHILTDRVSLVKSNGQLIKENIPARVDSKIIFITDSKLPIETGDKILRELPSKLVEEFTVEDPGFVSGIGGIKAHFEVKVRKGSSPPKEIGTIINNIQGNNARVNIASTDNSSNDVFSVRGSEIFSQLREALAASQISGEEVQKLQSAIDDLENADTKQSFQAQYIRFMEIAGIHAAVFGPLLGMLAGLG